MTLARTSFLSSIAVVVKLLTLLGINKILAVYLGPSGYAALGQYQNAVQMITTLGSGALNIGVTKYTAEYYDNEPVQRNIWATAGRVSLVGSTIVTVALLFFSKDLASSLLGDATLHSIFYWLAAGLYFFVFNALMLAILNGKKELALYVTANIVGSLLSFALTVGLAVMWGLYGALVALSIYQSIAFFTTYLICRRANWFDLRYFFGRFDSQAFVQLSHVSLMVIVSSVVVPVASIFVRDYLIISHGAVFAGYWEALTRMSGAYLMLITMTLSVYFLPRYSEIKDVNELRKEVFSGVILVITLTVILAGLVYIARDSLVLMLFDRDFLPMTELLPWQLTGDVLKMGGWVLGYMLWARALVLPFIVTEIFFSISFYGLLLALSDSMGRQAVVISYAINYLIYFVVLALYLHSWFKKQQRHGDQFSYRIG